MSPDRRQYGWRKEHRGRVVYYRTIGGVWYRWHIHGEAIPRAVHERMVELPPPQTAPPARPPRPPRARREDPDYLPCWRCGQGRWLHGIACLTCRPILNAEHDAECARRGVRYLYLPGFDAVERACRGLGDLDGPHLERADPRAVAHEGRARPAHRRGAVDGVEPSDAPRPRRRAHGGDARRGREAGGIAARAVAWWRGPGAAKATGMSFLEI